MISRPPSGLFLFVLAAKNLAILDKRIKSYISDPVIAFGWSLQRLGGMR
jgi:hypothetical protein